MDTPLFHELADAHAARAASGRHRLHPDHQQPDPPTEEMPRVTTTAPAPPPYIRYPRAAGGSYTARQVAAAYDAPIDHYDGTGTTIGVIELGGAINPADFAQAGLRDNTTSIGVDGAVPKSDPQGADGEVALDVQIIAAIAPGARQRVYFAPNTDAGFLNAIKQAVAECDAVSISWGGPETSWNPRSVDAFEKVFAAARAAGKPIFVAAGDAGSRDGTRSDTTDIPAGLPSAVGCGGTRLALGRDGARAGETVWNDDPTSSATGGGVSQLYRGRGVPDVAGDADPQTGYQIVVNGQAGVIGGTSAVAPLYVANWAVTRQASGARPYDFVNIVQTNPGICFDVTQGNNGGYKAGPGRDNVSGFGVVDWGKLLAVLMSGTQVPAPGGNTGGGAGGGAPTGGTGPSGGGATIPAPPAPLDLAKFLRWFRDVLIPLLLGGKS